jgi:hypothetical protein
MTKPAKPWAAQETAKQLRACYAKFGMPLPNNFFYSFIYIFYIIM